MSEPVTAIDLFSGGGGFTEGASHAGVNVLYAANHWPVAVAVHSENHPGTEHRCQDLQQADWRDVPRHDLLLASPACGGHSRARGRERPHHDALRSTAWAVVSCAEYHRSAAIVVENVPEFVDWTLYPVWCDALRRLGYSLTSMVLDAADHGVPQHRRRLILVGTRSRSPIELHLPRRAHQPVAGIIEWDQGRWSQVDKPGRSPATLHRVAAGRALFGPRFVAPYYGSGSGMTGRCLTRPIGTITTRDRWAVVDGDRMRMLSTNEAKAAMGFRSDYQLPRSHKTAMHLLGNAICPQLATDVLVTLIARL